MFVYFKYMFTSLIKLSSSLLFTSHSTIIFHLDYENSKFSISLIYYENYQFCLSLHSFYLSHLSHFYAIMLLHLCLTLSFHLCCYSNTTTLSHPPLIQSLSPSLTIHSVFLSLSLSLPHHPFSL